MEPSGLGTTWVLVPSPKYQTALSGSLSASLTTAEKERTSPGSAVVVDEIESMTGGSLGSPATTAIGCAKTVRLGSDTENEIV